MKWYFFTVKLELSVKLIVWCRIEFMVLTWTHGIDLDSWYKLRLKALAKSQTRIGRRQKKALAKGVAGCTFKLNDTSINHPKLGGSKRC